MTTPKGNFPSSALSSSKPSDFPKLDNYDIPRKVPYLLIFPNRKKIPTKCNIYLVTTYKLIEDVGDYGIIKLK